MSGNVPKQHKAAQVKQKNGKLEIVTKDTPQPGQNEVLIKVTASGICSSDHFTVSGAMNSPYPLSPGHEVVGRVAALGKGLHERWTVGQRVGLGWNGGYCTKCNNCRDQDPIHCDTHRVTGVTQDGGHQEYVLADETALVNLPQELNFTDAELAPLLCAGITTWDALHASGARAGDLVIVQALGGLGHIAVQIARKAGCVVACISGSPEKEKLAKELGAHYYFSSKDDLPKEFAKIGLAKAAIATAPSGDAPKKLIPLLDRYGSLLIVGTPNDGKPLEVGTFDLISKGCRVQGLACGPAATNERFTNWCNLMDVKAMVSKKWSLDQANEAYEDTMNGKPMFRNVIVMD